MYYTIIIKRQRIKISKAETSFMQIRFFSLSANDAQTGL